MKLLKTAAQLSEYIKVHDMSDMCNRLFAFTYGPMMAVEPSLAVTLDELCYHEPAYIPFKYIGYLRKMSMKTTPSEIKGYLKKVTLDLDTLKNHYISSGLPYDLTQWKIIEETLKAFVVTTIHELRDYQYKYLIMESYMSDFSPVVPYGITMKKASLNETWTPVVAEKSEVDDQPIFVVTGDYHPLKEILIRWNRIEHPNDISGDVDNQIMELMTSHVSGLITFQKALYNINSVTDALQCALNLEGTLPNEVAFDYAIIYLLNLRNAGEAPTYAQLSEIITNMELLTKADKPLTDTQFAAVFESLSHSLSPETVSESWSALSDDAQQAANKLLEDGPLYKVKTDYDLDKLLSTVYNMRYIEFSENANQTFETSLTDGKITSINHMGDNMIIYEIDGKDLVIPYVDIADDYTIKTLCMFSDGSIDENAKFN